MPEIQKVVGSDTFAVLLDGNQSSKSDKQLEKSVDINDENLNLDLQETSQPKRTLRVLRKKSVMTKDNLASEQIFLHLYEMFMLNNSNFVKYCF